VRELAGMTKRSIKNHLSKSTNDKFESLMNEKAEFKFIEKQV
jgi:hypothetical protein